MERRKDTCNKICIWDNLMDSKSLLLTGNTSTMYCTRNLVN